MKITIAPDSFKGCLTALEVCQAIEQGLWAVLPDVEVVSVPMADGGEGTVQSLVEATNGEFVTRTVEGPLGEAVDAVFGVLGDGATAVIEMAAASGLPLVPANMRNPLLTSTYGTGQLILAALEMGCRSLIVGIGGSATTDCGAGMAQALGVRMLGADGAEIDRVTGGRMAEVARIDVSSLDPRVWEATFRVACDVDNPLFGERGAAHVYGPQKGATPEMVRALDDGLRHFSALMARDLDCDVAEVPGAGAAGGLGAGLMAFCGAKLERGVKIVVDAVGLRERMAGSGLVITGEGRIDFQTAFGKTPSGVADVANDLGVPVVAIGGGVALNATELHSRGFHALFPIVNEPMTLEEAMQPARARELLVFTAEQLLRTYLLGTGRK
ncbi:MAG: glycerate kinase [Armatimonadetes bacterium]|nr:glycerate kinase [Armatimonadota bacterium]MDI9585538.1 glycerate kinase [Acidobacteriota bacterium]